MKVIIDSLILIGIVVMVSNIVRYAMFVHTTHDVLSSGSKRDRAWKALAFVLLVFFLCGYIFIVVASKPDLMMAMILFGGSLFVAIVLTLMFNLLETAKARSIDIAEVLVGVIDARDPNLNGHSRHVQNITMLFYKYLVPESILNKPAKLDDDEWEVMRSHPKVGVEILKPLRTFDHVASWILYHHERIDGKGYYKLPGEEIPLAARIISIADTYSAITMRRSYKEPRTHEDALKIMKEVAGKQLDAELLEYFFKIPKEELEVCIPEKVKY